jgi:transposase
MADDLFSQRQIATTLRISRNTVSNTLAAAKEHGLSWHKVKEESMDESQVRAQLYPQKLVESDYEQPACDHIEKELRKVGVTLQLLWLEYCDRAHANGKRPYMYSRYCDNYRTYSQKNKATMHIKRTPDEEVEVDWAGKIGYLKDPVSGELVPVYISVASMSYSQYSYAEGFLKMDIDAWITAHIHLFEFLGAVPKTIIPDNLKTAVSPTYRQIIRNWQNTHAFQKKTGSRATLFAQERDLLTHLPKTRYEMATWKVATVQPNYHISVDGMFYSVPFQYISQKLNVKSTSSLIEIYKADSRITSHWRLQGRKECRKWQKLSGLCLGNVRLYETV